MVANEVTKMFRLEPIHIFVDKTLLECLGSGYVHNIHFIIWKGRFEQSLFFKDNSKPENDGWYALCEVEKEKVT